MVHVAECYKVKENEGQAEPLDLVSGKSLVVPQKAKLMEWMRVGSGFQGVEE